MVMKVHVRTNVIDDLVGSKATLALPERACFNDLLDHLKKKFGREMEARLFTNGKLKSHLTVLVNGRPLSDEDFKREIPQPCEVCLLQMLSGG
jgi:hypothetical protein